MNASTIFYFVSFLLAWNTSHAFRPGYKEYLDFLETEHNHGPEQRQLRQNRRQTKGRLSKSSKATKSSNSNVDATAEDVVDLVDNGTAGGTEALSSSPSSAPSVTFSDSPTSEPTGTIDAQQDTNNNNGGLESEPNAVYPPPSNVCESVTVVWNVTSSTTNFQRIDAYSNVLSYDLLSENDFVTKVGEYADFSSSTTNNDCIFNGVYSFDYNPNLDTFASQIFIQGTCRGFTNIITGGTGKYQCASGFQTLNEYATLPGNLAVTLDICYMNCAAMGRR